MITNEEIHNIYLHQGGVAEGLLRAGADADFPALFANALLEFYKLKNKNLLEAVEIPDAPVAWIRSGDDQLSLVKDESDGYMVWKPLYTHPATAPMLVLDGNRVYPVKELTDEEIENVYQSLQLEDYIRKQDCIDFARAILRKAQEK